MNSEIDKIKHMWPSLRFLDKIFEEEFLATQEDMLGAARTQRLPQYRAIYINMAKTIAPSLTYRELGLLVNRSHSNAIWCLKNYKNWLKYDKHFRVFNDIVKHKFNQLTKEKENELD